MNLLSMLPQLLQTAPAIYTGLKGKNIKPQKRLAGEMEGLARAQYDMDSPVYQKLYRQEQDAGQQDLASAISEISRQNRKLTSMGRNPLLDKERGGESIFRNLIMGQQDVGERARRNTMDYLSSAQRSLSGAYDAQDLTQGQDYDNDLLKVGGLYSLGDALKNIFGLGKRGETINWR